MDENFEPESVIGDSGATIERVQVKVFPAADEVLALSPAGELERASWGALLLALRGAPVSILILRPDFTIVDATERYLSDTMRSRDELVGLSIFVAFPENPSDAAGNGGVSAVRGSLERVCQTGRPDAMPVQRYDIQRRDGAGFETRYWNPINTPALGDDGSVALIYHQVTDVTDVTEYISTVSELGRSSDLGQQLEERTLSVEREIVERSTELHRTLGELRASEERFRLVCDATSDALWDWDLASDRLWWSDGIERLFGYRPADLSSFIDSWTTLIHPDDHDIVIASISDAIERGAVEWDREYRFLHRNGGVVWVEDRCLILRDARGVAYRLVGGMSDITEQRFVEEQLFRSQRLDSLGMLAGGIAHDLNNVLAPVLVGAEMLLADEPEPARRETLEVMIQSATRGASMVQQVLTFASGSEAATSLVVVTDLMCDLSRLLREALPADVVVHLDVPDVFECVVDADTTKLHQVLMNLCLNGRDAMPNGGVLGLSCRLEVHTTVPHVVISVADTGTGIDPATLERMFDPFFSTKSSEQGTGLGLSISHSIVRGFGGSIHVESEVGTGSTFEVHLPIATAVVTSLPQRELPGGNGQRVLVVDDEESILAISRHILEASGYHVMTASSGAAAISLLDDDDSDVEAVVVDLIMPNLDGCATVEALRRIRPDLRFVLASGIGAEALLDSATDIGVHHVLAKPYTAAELLYTLADALTFA